MTVTYDRQLRKFFGLSNARGQCLLYLPTFSGPVSLVTETAHLRGEPASGDGLQYLGNTFADRDAKAALYVTSILSRAVESSDIRWEDPRTYSPGQPGTAFLFGSRSNQAAEQVTSSSTLGKFIQFRFGAMWSILAGEEEFSIPAPDKLTRTEYEQKTDYGVIGRFRGPIGAGPAFLIAGLGGRATEGCAYFLTRHWGDLAAKFRERDFAVILRFPPPIDPLRSEVVAEFN